MNRLLDCELCPRLRAHCANIAHEKRAAYQQETYWGRPVPPFGDPTKAALVVIGLAPAAHGANRTGRMFTGDRSGEWLYRTLHEFGFASQPTSTHLDDGLVLYGTAITAVVKCAPPDNRPTPAERKICSVHLKNELIAPPHPQVWVTLGKMAYDDTFKQLREQLGPRFLRPPPFRHGLEILVSPNLWILSSYHPSQQNTFTGVLTESMFSRVFERARARVREADLPKGAVAKHHFSGAVAKVPDSRSPKRG